MTMTRSSFRPMASVGLVAAVLAYVGCAKTRESGDRTDGKVAPTPSTTKTNVAHEKPGGAKGEKVLKLIADWSANPPAGILLISGEQDGYPDPCGCTDGQLGGLGRRYDFLEKLQAKGWPVAKVDLGNLIHYRGDSRGGPKQEQIKFEIIIQALEAMKYDAVALGPEDLKLGVLDAVGTLLNHEEPKFLAANVKPADQGLAATVRPIKIAKAGPVTIGITAVLDPASYEGLQDANLALLTVKSPDEVLPGILDELKKQSQVRVLMVQGPYDEARRLAEKFPDFDIVIGTSEFADPDARPETVNGGKTMLIRNIGKKGKHVGVVGFFPGSTPMIQFRRQSLDARDFRQAEPMRKLIDEEYQDRLKREGVVENFARFPNGKAPAGAKYIGAESCQACHPKTFEKWSTTKHAKAFDALTNPRRNRVYDAECISCHTTGFGNTTGWVSAEKTPWLKGNQCENCHGPASLHAAEPDNLAYRKPMAMTAESANSSNFCIKCHDEDNDHNYSFDARYAQIFHKGLDTYDDPKVHKPQPAKVAGGQK
jgi:Cytochrome c554 and c-prime